MCYLKMLLFLGLIFTILCRVTAIKTVDEEIQGVKDSVTFATDVKGLKDKIQKTAEFMKRFHDMSTDPQRNFTWAEVAKCDGEGSNPLYIVISDNVYDVTEYAQYHPAGPAPLKRHAGQDATSAVKVMNADIFEPFLHYFQVGCMIQKDNSTASQYALNNSINNRF